MGGKYWDMGFGREGVVVEVMLGWDWVWLLRGFATG